MKIGTTLPEQFNRRLRASNELAASIGVLPNQMKDYNRVLNHEGWWVKIEKELWMLELDV